VEIPKNDAQNAPSPINVPEPTQDQILESRFQKAAQEITARYPVLNQSSPQFNQSVVDNLLARMNGYVQQGISKDQALYHAVADMTAVMNNSPRPSSSTIINGGRAMDEKVANRVKPYEYKSNNQVVYANPVENIERMTQKIPANAYAYNDGHVLGWECYRGYVSNGKECIANTHPNEESATVQYKRLDCPTGSYQAADKCVDERRPFWDSQ
jgi:hypothetical protein